MNIQEQLHHLRSKIKKFTPHEIYTPNLPDLKAQRLNPLNEWVCTFDLETTNLYGNFMGVILCGCIKPWGKPILTFRGDDHKAWGEGNRSDDSEICIALYTELKKYPIWIAHNGLAFDINFLRTRLMKWGIPMAQPKNIDPVRLARKYLRMKFNTLEALGEHLGYYGKTKVDQSIWNAAALDGSKEALDYIVDHCKADVKLLENVTNDLRYLCPKVTQFGSEI